MRVQLLLAKRYAGLVVTLLISLAWTGSAMAQQNPAIQGYSPVSYFTKHIAEHGSADHQYQYKDKLYYFTSQEQIKLFAAQPEKYLPRYGAYCPYSLTLGRHVAIDPTNFKIVGGSLLLFHRSDEMDALQEWNSKKNEKKLLKEADDQFILLRF